MARHRKRRRRNAPTRLSARVDALITELIKVEKSRDTTYDRAEIVKLERAMGYIEKVAQIVATIESEHN